MVGQYAAILGRSRFGLDVGLDRARQAEADGDADRPGTSADFSLTSATQTP